MCDCALMPLDCHSLCCLPPCSCVTASRALATRGRRARLSSSVLSSNFQENVNGIRRATIRTLATQQAWENISPQRSRGSEQERKQLEEQLEEIEKAVSHIHLRKRQCGPGMGNVDYHY
jgi:hypothetical protein